MNDLKTPVSRLLRLVGQARDRWKAKALERQQRLRAAQVRIRDLVFCAQPLEKVKIRES
jgi:hypothetical protein